MWQPLNCTYNNYDQGDQRFLDIPKASLSNLSISILKSISQESRELLSVLLVWGRVNQSLYYTFCKNCIYSLFWGRYFVSIINPARFYYLLIQMYSVLYLFQGAKLYETDKGKKKLNSYNNNRIGTKEVKTVTTVISCTL